MWEQEAETSRVHTTQRTRLEEEEVEVESERAELEEDRGSLSVSQLRAAYMDRVRAESRAARRYTPKLQAAPMQGIPEEVQADRRRKGESLRVGEKGKDER